MAPKLPVFLSPVEFGKRVRKRHRHWIWDGLPVAVTETLYVWVAGLSTPLQYAGAVAVGLVTLYGFHWLERKWRALHTVPLDMLCEKVSKLEGESKGLRKECDEFQRQLLARALDVYVNGVRAINLGDGSRPTFFVSVANDGSTSARDVMVTVHIDTNDNTQEYKTPQKLDIPSKDSKEVHLLAAFVISPDSLEGSNNGQNRLEVSGSVEYRGTSTPYCYRYKPWEGKRPEGVPMFVPCDHDERTNQTVKLRGMAISMGSAFGALTVKRSTPDTAARPEPEPEREHPET